MAEPRKLEQVRKVDSPQPVTYRQLLTLMLGLGFTILSTLVAGAWTVGSRILEIDSSRVSAILEAQRSLLAEHARQPVHEGGTSLRDFERERQVNLETHRLLLQAIDKQSGQIDKLRDSVQNLARVVSGHHGNRRRGAPQDE